MALIMTTAAGVLSACAPPYEAMPTSVYQWQRRQDEIVARDAERARVCATLNKDADRYRRDCQRPGEAR